MLALISVVLNEFLLLLRYHTASNKKSIISTFVHDYLKLFNLFEDNKCSLTCNKFEFIGIIFFALFAAAADALTPLDADDSLDSSETVSLNAESLSGLSVRDSRAGPLESEPLPFPLSDDMEIDEFVAPDIVEFDRECVRPLRAGVVIFGACCVVIA